MVASISESISKPPSTQTSAAAAAATTPRTVHSAPEKHNARRPRAKHVPSRYLSPSPSTSTSTTTTTTATTATTATSSSSSSRRFGSPLISRSTNTAPLPCAAPKRSQSADRRRPSPGRPVTPGPQHNAGELSAAAKLLVTSTRSSTRSLSVSFQGEAFSLPISKEKANAGSAPARKATPERKRATPVRDRVENPKVSDQHRWPGRTRQANPGMEVNLLSRSMDWGSDSMDDGKKFAVFGSEFAGKFLRQSSVDDCRRVSFDGRLSLDLGHGELINAVSQNAHPDTSSVNESSVHSEFTASDTDSVSSGSTSGVQECGKPKSGPRGIAVSAKFWQETNSRLRRLQDPGSPFSPSPGSRMSAPSKLVQSKRFSNESPIVSPRNLASPTRGVTRPPSPSKLWASSVSSPLRGMQSPSRARPGSGGLNSNSSSSCVPSILSFSVDIRRGKIGEDRIGDAHRLRLLHNCYLQWRFANARADATFIIQRQNAEKDLWGAWITISELRHSVTVKRMKLLLLKQRLKLTSILKGQMTCMEEWSLLERDHSSSLLGATEALRASTLRLPIVGSAIADMQNLKDVIGSAISVMQGMASSIYSLSSKVEEMNSLVAELVDAAAKERFSLEQCRDLLSSFAALQVKDCSLRTHILQSNRVPISSSLTTRV
ncbi:QWRF motif-containing protein 2-like isoform X1 [Syzygium oleosum]|uniref:QWRF motif-containing protein 2-like isoform X1 n=1 Tax=Syzygium oleosum TaxID=219896 RepID=UPI0024B900C7|nr:QWRF motif-containing protein 2-like isoform X1 [Syzygium oleosum]XP_056160794.1 QWRF motif-containing protein 2-like isoform X1 [Syzygium oleosum]